MNFCKSIDDNELHQQQAWKTTEFLSDSLVNYLGKGILCEQQWNSEETSCIPWIFIHIIKNNICMILNILHAHAVAYFIRRESEKKKKGKIKISFSKKKNLKFFKGCKWTSYTEMAMVKSNKAQAWNCALIFFTSF